MSKTVAALAGVTLLVVSGALIHRHLRHHRKASFGDDAVAWGYNCSQYTNCGDCMNSNIGNCGWCSLTNNCSAGSTSGPYANNCPAPYWNPAVYGSCPNTFCGSFTSCGSCTQAWGGNTCGWCSIANACMNGTRYGPANPSKYCWSSAWSFGWNATCPIPPNPTTNTPAPAQSNCYQYSDCYSCTTAPSGQCGFCAQTKQCTSGSVNGPNYGSCPAQNWEWYSSQCQDPKAKVTGKK